jgi:hypothetical protein
MVLVLTFTSLRSRRKGLQLPSPTFNLLWNEIKLQTHCPPFSRKPPPLKTILLPKLCKRDNLWRTCSSHHSLRISGIVLSVQKRPFPRTYAKHVAARSQLEGDLKRFPSVLQSLIVALFVQFCAKSSSLLYRRCRVVPARNGLVKACALCRSVFLCRISRTDLDNLYWIHLTHTFLTSRTHAFRSPNPNQKCHARRRAIEKHMWWWFEICCRGNIVARINYHYSTSWLRFRFHRMHVLVFLSSIFNET